MVTNFDFKKFKLKLKSFVSNIVQAVPVSPYVKLVIKRAKIPCKRTPPIGILHRIKLGSFSISR